MPEAGVSCQEAAGFTGRPAVLPGRGWWFSRAGGGVADGDDGLGGAGGGVAAGAGECGAGLGLAGAVPVPAGDDAASAERAGSAGGEPVRIEASTSGARVAGLRR